MYLITTLFILFNVFSCACMAESDGQSAINAGYVSNAIYATIPITGPCGKHGIIYTYSDSQMTEMANREVEAVLARVKDPTLPPIDFEALRADIIPRTPLTP